MPSAISTHTHRQQQKLHPVHVYGYRLFSDTMDLFFQKEELMHETANNWAQKVKKNVRF